VTRAPLSVSSLPARGRITPPRVGTAAVGLIAWRALQALEEFGLLVRELPVRQDALRVK